MKSGLDARLRPCQAELRLGWAVMNVRGVQRWSIQLAIAGWLSVGAWGCADSSNPTAPTPPTAPSLPVVSLTISGGSVLSGSGASYGPGEPARFAAVATLSDGSTQSVTHLAQWISSKPEVATVQPGGEGRAVAPGEAQVVARYQGLEASTTMRVRAVDYIYFNDNRLRPYVSIGSTAQLSVSYTLEDYTMKTITSIAAWESSDPGIATVTPGGLVTGVTAGTAEIRVSFGGFTEVSPAWVPVAGCAYSASPAKLFPDGTFGGSTIGFTITVEATAGCRWTATSNYPRFEVRAYQSGPTATGGTGSGTVFLQCVNEFDRCGSAIATFEVAGTHIVKYSKH